MRSVSLIWSLLSLLWMPLVIAKRPQGDHFRRIFYLSVIEERIERKERTVIFQQIHYQVTADAMQRWWENLLGNSISFHISSFLAFFFLRIFQRLFQRTLNNSQRSLYAFDCFTILRYRRSLRRSCQNCKSNAKYFRCMLAFIILRTNNILVRG